MDYHKLKEKMNKLIERRQEFVDLVSKHTCKQWVKEQIMQYDNRIRSLKHRYNELMKKNP